MTENKLWINFNTIMSNIWIQQKQQQKKTSKNLHLT